MEQESHPGGFVDAPQREMPKYQCHKVVHALKIRRYGWKEGGKVLQIVPDEKGYAPFDTSEEWARRWCGHDLTGGYYVVYADGYKSFSPAKAFEEGYTLLHEVPPPHEKRQMKPATLGRTVLYVLSDDDVDKINRRRTTGASIAERLSGANPTWPIGAQAHIGNTAFVGQVCPAVVVRDWKAEGVDAGVEPKSVNLQVFLDGNDVYWATSVHQAEGDHPELEYGKWHWPQLV